MVLVSIVLDQFLVLAQTWWLGEWADQYDPRHPEDASNVSVSLTFEVERRKADADGRFYRTLPSSFRLPRSSSISSTIASWSSEELLLCPSGSLFGLEELFEGPRLFSSFLHATGTSRLTLLLHVASLQWNGYSQEAFDERLLSYPSMARQFVFSLPLLQNPSRRLTTRPLLPFQ